MPGMESGRPRMKILKIIFSFYSYCSLSEENACERI